jgi:hypothetical protein
MRYPERLAGQTRDMTPRTDDAIVILDGDLALVERVDDEVTGCFDRVVFSTRDVSRVEELAL